jgi:hypothetical protein
MRHIRFSIAWLLLVVLFVAVAVAAHREATDLWDSALFGLTSLTLLTAVLLAVHRDRWVRAFWLGFALFGWSYLIASLVPPVGDRLPATRAMTYLHSKVPRAVPTGLGYFEYGGSDGRVDLFAANASAPGALYRNRGDGTFRDVTPGRAATVDTPSGGVVVWKPSLPWKVLSGPKATTENFVRIGNSLTALVLAYAGGRLSRRLYETGRRGGDALAGAVAGPTVRAPAGRQEG